MRRYLPLLVSAASFLFFAVVSGKQLENRTIARGEVFDRVVVSAPVQLLLAGGDRFLAANLESIRAIATASDSPQAAESNVSFAIRARKIVSLLNACHEENYYFGNALLTWGGAVSEGNELLRRATYCRTWDELPPFFYGFNLFYFNRDIVQARNYLEIAASRAKDNAATFRKLAIMVSADRFEDDATALAYLKSERDGARDMKLRQMLEKRIGRLEGLIALREAQKTYEARFGKPLSVWQDLIDTRILAKFPEDPMRIGYEFSDGRFKFREIKVAGAAPGKQ